MAFFKQKQKQRGKEQKQQTGINILNLFFKNEKSSRIWIKWD